MNLTFPFDTASSPSLIVELLYQMKVRDVMTTELITANIDQSLRDLQNLMKENQITGIPIVDKGRAVGIISMDDIIRALDGGHIEEKASDYMTRNLIVLEDDMPLSFSISYMQKFHFGRFPVVNREGQLVGIITSRDIIMHLLIAMNKELEAMEEAKKDSRPISNAGEEHRQYQTRKFDFENAGKASTEIKRIIKKRGLPSKLARRVAVASYELEMNQVVHSVGGQLTFSIGPEQIKVVAKDNGPGIPDLGEALTEGFSTANDWIRSLGFGAGMGLPNTKRVADEFSIQSEEEIGTTVTVVFYIEQQKEKRETDHDSE